jgi:hypothetical protein
MDASDHVQYTLVGRLDDQSRRMTCNFLAQQWTLEFEMHSCQARVV